MNYQLLLFIIQYLKFRLIRSKGLLGRGIFQNPLSAGVVFYPPSALNDSTVAMGFKNHCCFFGRKWNHLNVIFIYLFFRDALSMLYLSRPLQSLARFRPEGDTLTIMSRGCPGVPECNSTFFLPWLILCWLCWCLKCRFWHWRNLRESLRPALILKRRLRNVVVSHITKVVLLWQ